MKKILSVALVTGVMCLALILCGNGSKSLPLPQTAEIFLIDRCENHAWGYRDDGIFVDTSGAVYAFDFGMSVSGRTSDEQLLEKFDIIRDNTEPIMTIDNDTITELYSLGSRINRKSRLNYSSSVAFDAGSHTVSFCEPDTARMTVCREHGDREGTLGDSFAKRFVMLYDKKINDAKPEFTAPLVYADYDIHMSSVECNAEMSGMYFLSSDEQLRILAKQCGASIDAMLDDYDYYEWGRYVYFVELNAAPANAVLCTDNGYKLSHTDGSGFCNVAAFPRLNGNFVSDSIPCADGGEWQRIKDGDLNSDPDFITGEAYGFSETAMREVWHDFDMHGFKGLYIPDSETYEEFIKSCDSHGLVENGSIRGTLEENGAPDFGKYSLCVKLDSHNDDTEYEWQRTEIGDGYIAMGSSISLNWTTRVGECTLAYVLIPKIYLPEDTYIVSCLNNHWKEETE